MDKTVVLPTTMKRVLKAFSGLHRTEKKAAEAACAAADEWLHSKVSLITVLANKEGRTTVSGELTGSVVGSQRTESHRPWLFSKTRLRDRIKLISPRLRWSLEAKRILCEAFQSYLHLLALRISSTQLLARRKTIGIEHVNAAVNVK